MILESAKQKILRALERIKYLYKGVSQGAQPMGEFYQAEYLDKQHRYGRNIAIFFNIWKDSTSTDEFNEWIEKFEQGKHNELGLTPQKLEEMHQKKFIEKDYKLPFLSQVLYLDEVGRKNYEMQINSKGIFTLHDGLLHTADPHHHPHIFVVAPDKKIYIGIYERGFLHHSSFLSGAPVLASGEFLIQDGKIVTITDKSGHYTPIINGRFTPSVEMIIKGLKALKQQGVDLSPVQLILNSLSSNGSKQELNALSFLLEAEQKELENDPKNQGNMSRQEAENRLAQADDHAWLLRYSPSQNQYVISERVAPNQYDHYFVSHKSLEEWKKELGDSHMLPRLEKKV